MRCDVCSGEAARPYIFKKKGYHPECFAEGAHKRNFDDLKAGYPFLSEKQLHRLADCDENLLTLRVNYKWLVLFHVCDEARIASFIDKGFMMDFLRENAESSCIFVEAMFEDGARLVVTNKKRIWQHGVQLGREAKP